MTHLTQTACWTTAIAILSLLVARTTTAAPPESILEAERVRVAAIATATPTFVAVFANEGNGGGSGVVISPEGYALTNFHVAKPAGNHMKCGMQDGRLYDAVIVGLDPTGDIALIKLLGRDDFPAAALADSDALHVGDWCFAVGNPFLLATDFQPTVTYGLVSGLHRCQYPAGTLLEYTDAVQTDASINPGNSGGPLFNARGELIGIVGSGSFDKRGRVNVGVGYAISINQVKNFLGCLKSGRLVDHATLGATVATDDQGRVHVNNILEESDAYRRGLRYGDEIVQFGGRRITSANGFKSVLGTFPQGWIVPLQIRRAGKDLDLQVRLAGLLTPDQLNDKATKAFSEEKSEPKSKQQPKPGDKPPADLPKDAQPHKGDTPPEIAAMVEPRTGFANYYFNRLNRDRVWKSLEKYGGRLPKEDWNLSGKTTKGMTMHALIRDQMSEGSFATGNVRLEGNQDLNRQLDPPQSGGMIAALHLLRLFLREGPEKFGDVYYYGTKPAVLGDQLYDVLIATRNVAELHVWSNIETGDLVRAEFYLGDERDPCELHFINTEDDTPKIEVHHAGQLFGELTFDTVAPANEGATP